MPSTLSTYIAMAGNPYPKAVDIKRVMKCNLPAVWLYLKAIGQEELYFKLLEDAKTRPSLYKHIFFLLKLADRHDRFFPKLDFGLKLKISRPVADALIDVKPVFAMTYDFSSDQLRETIELIAKPDAMVRLGTKSRSVGLMYSSLDNSYYVYSVGKMAPTKCHSPDACVAEIFKAMRKPHAERLSVFVSASYLQGMSPAQKLLPNPPQLFKKFLRDDFSKGVRLKLS